MRKFKITDCVKNQISPNSSASDIADLLSEAAWVARRLPANGVRPADVRCAWPDVLHDKWTAYGWEALEARSERPTAAQIDLLDQATEIILRAPEDRRRLLWDVASGMSWRKVARRHGIHPDTARRRWTEVILKISNADNPK